MKNRGKASNPYRIAPRPVEGRRRRLPPNDAEQADGDDDGSGAGHDGN